MDTKHAGAKPLHPQAGLLRGSLNRPNRGRDFGPQYRLLHRRHQVEQRLHLLRCQRYADAANVLHERLGG